MEVTYPVSLLKAESAMHTKDVVRAAELLVCLARKKMTAEASMKRVASKSKRDAVQITASGRDPCNPKSRAAITLPASGA